MSCPMLMKKFISFEEVYFVLLNSDIEWGPVDTAEEAIEWASDVRDGYYSDDEDYEEEWPDADDDIDFIDLYGVHGEYDDDYGVQKRHLMKESEEDGLEDAAQEYTSANTSINSTKLPAIFSMVSFKPETINLDYGGGKFDNATNELSSKGVTNLIYDPYNRSAVHNKDVIDTIRKNGGADTATCSNVLNVIKEPEARRVVIKNIYNLLKNDGIAYFTVYEGTGKGDEGPTKAGYQLNKKTADYVEEISSVFPSVSRRGKLIVAIKGITEDTVKRNGKWVNVGNDGKADSGKFDSEEDADAQRKAMFANGYKESIKKACRRGNAMNEGVMKEIDLEVQEAGGVDAYIDSLESQLRSLSREMRFLRGQARREMKAGGAYDSVDEINDALKATEREYNEVRKKYDYISSQQTGGVN